ncbi:MAG: hypothetical protein RLZZ15_2143 [Verrucomicrobiota bacterium]
MRAPRMNRDSPFRRPRCFSERDDASFSGPPVCAAHAARMMESRPNVVIGAAALLFGALVFALLPADVVPVGPDEFGYLKSAVETIQRGRPWTDDFLEPWAAAMTSFSALIYHATSSMRAAIHGQIAVLAVATFAGLCALLRARTGSAARAIAISAAVLLCPVVLRRLSEYIDLIVFLPALFWCVWAVERRRWGLFFVLWCIAVANRQSAIVWLLLPAAAWLRARIRENPRDRATTIWAASVVVLGVLWFLAVMAGMNTTDIQFDRTLRPFADLRLSLVAQALLAGLGVFLLAVGFGAFVLGWRGAAPLRPWRGAARWTTLAALGLTLFFDARQLVRTDVAYDFFYGPLGAIYAKLFVLAAAWGWLRVRFHLRLELLACALATLGLVGLRQMVFDRYAIEIGCLALFAVSVPPTAETSADAAPRLLQWLPAGLVAALLVLAIPFTLLTKLAIDESRALSRLHETALREKQIRPSEIGQAPFPFRGWYLHAYSIAHPMASGRKLGAYMRLTEPTVQVWSEPPHAFARLRGTPEPRPRGASANLGEGSFRVGWFWQARYGLVRLAAPREPGPLVRDFRAVSLPLDEAEWRALIRGPFLR